VSGLICESAYECSLLLEWAKSIANALADRDYHYDDVNSLNLANGLAGRAVLFAHMASAESREEKFRDLATSALQTIASTLPQVTPLLPGMFSGVCGIAWATQHVSALLQLSEYRLADTFEDIVTFIEGYLDRDIEFEYDLIAGVTGIGLWALSLENEEWRDRIIARVLLILRKSAKVTTHGFSWQTPELRRKRVRAEISPLLPEFNLGVAHGVPGVIGFLSLCLKKNCNPAEVCEMLAPVVDDLRAQTLGPYTLSAFATTTGDSTPSRLAWCYGDAGISLVLYMAASALSSPNIRALADDTRDRFLVRRRDDFSSVVDATLCHGSAGLLHICTKLAEHGSSSKLAAAATFWRHHLLEKREEKLGICGFPCWDGLRRRYRSNPAMLAGAAGIALVMVSQVTKRFDWDYPFLAG
jgi:lantibiotic biosynthesis protein